MVSAKVSDDTLVARLHRKLVHPHTSLSQKYRVLFSLRNMPGSAAEEAIVEGKRAETLLSCLKDASALFRHEVAYCLGQRQDAAAIKTLKEVLADSQEHCMVRHEAGEALGAIGTATCLKELQQYVQDPCLEARIQYHNQHGTLAEQDESRYLSVDPTPAAPSSTPANELRAKLVDEQARIFDRYRAMFALRNKGGQEAVSALGEAFGSQSALLKHEVAYVLGQMQDALAVSTLRHVLRDESEHAMVRHEAAEALGSIASPDCLQLLTDYCKDPELIVADSCVVALDMLEFEQSGAFQYADTGVAVEA
ncbi:MAG: deoxyhypusine hydroxylase [Trebouxia sp. A1-2]|nr:MAG: deoxyhypusine hydroxylase [Trebouxia sp. A1-2]